MNVPEGLEDVVMILLPKIPQAPQGAPRLHYLLFLGFLYLLPVFTSARKLLDYCSPPGPHTPYVSAKFLRSSQSFQQKLTEITSFLEEISQEAESPLVWDHEGVAVGGVNLAVAITTPTETIYTYNYGLRSSLTGPSPWTEHTIFRVASVSKALTVWELIRLGIGWDEKVVKYLPELLDGRYGEEWSEVTVGALAGYVGGALRDFEHDISLRPEHVPKTLYKRDGWSGSREKEKYYYIPEDILENIMDIDGYVESIWTSYLPEFQPSEAWKLGFPPLDEIEENRCLYNCTRQDLLRRIANRPLIYPAYTIPAYSNVGFSLLGLVLERKSGLDFEDLMQRDMYGPLGMKDTFHKLPWDAQYKKEGWAAHPFWGANDTWHETREIWGDWGIPAGGIFTSAHDLSIFLRSILAAFPYGTDHDSSPNKHSLLPAEKIREWLTPSGFTGGKSLLGRPWEIKRKKYPGCHGERPVTLYSKAGGGTGYNAAITIVPEYGIGITVLVAGDGGTFRAENRRWSYHWSPIRRMLLEETGLLQAIEQAAYEETEREYLGEYLFNSFIIDGDDGMGLPYSRTKIQPEPIFSGIELIRDHGPGLRIKRWISNGTDFLQTMIKVKMQMTVKEVHGAVAIARLYPVGNMRGRGPRRWAEDWRIWFEWEWENLEEAKTRPYQWSPYWNPYMPTPLQANRGSQAPPWFNPWNRGKSRAVPPDPIHALPVNMPWQVWPDIFPGAEEQDEISIVDGDGVPQVPEVGTHEEGIPTLKGWPRPTKSRASTSSSENSAKTWKNTIPNDPRRPLWKAKYDRKNPLHRVNGEKKSHWIIGGDGGGDENIDSRSADHVGITKENQGTFLGFTEGVARSRKPSVLTGAGRQTPIWWREKFDRNDDLRGYRDRHSREHNSQETVSEDGENEREEEEHRVNNGQKDKFISYTFKKSESHGLPWGEHDEEEVEDDQRGAQFQNGLHERDFEYNTFMKIHSHDEEDDEEFYIPDHPPHAPVVPMVYDMESPNEIPDEEVMSPTYQQEQYGKDNIYMDYRGDFTVDEPVFVHDTHTAQWEYWKVNEEGRRASKMENQRWPCADYNGIELQAWSGWSMGLVRFLREGRDKRVIGMEIPALKVRLGKVGSGVVRPIPKGVHRESTTGATPQQQRQVYSSPRSHHGAG